VAFILSDERDADPVGAFDRYRAYMDREEARFPARALSLIKSDWYFNPEDHRCPHDAWLEVATMREPASGARHEIRHLTFSIELLGAYHDLRLRLSYPRVFGYQFLGDAVAQGHSDWRYDEFRVSNNGHLLHEIEWWGHEATSRWLIEADDVVFEVETL